MTDTGYDEWLDGLADGRGYYLECDRGHGSLPPRRTCPHCGSAELREANLPESGTVETFTVIRVAAPNFADDVPYVSAVCAFGTVRLTGVLRGVDPDAVQAGMPVEASVEKSETAGERLLAFRPR
ncbi:Zn-ribbon domain-containing OB-fold protein [Halegenticoccus soli]|uniref:Zn-ribbon domain-containing OB-fold protein n=1 Tax=Halegenticoccus soli TaxID=1985678 RepID=UPI000C6D5453|nr:OB-fold domain-containing protein [Halegenticoccus soli]